MRVIIEDYNTSWPIQFQQIKTKLETILQEVDYLSIEHVGSTSVPGLAAKPIFDVDIVVTGPNLDQAIQALKKQGGYTYYGEWGIPDRHAFRREGQIPEINLYICLDGCQALRNHLAVRNICRENDTVRDAYGSKKKELGQQEWLSFAEYCEAKNDILAWVLQQAGMSIEEMEAVRKLNTLEDHQKQREYWRKAL